MSAERGLVQVHIHACYVNKRVNNFRFHSKLACGGHGEMDPRSGIRKRSPWTDRTRVDCRSVVQSHVQTQSSAASATASWSLCSRAPCSTSSFSSGQRTLRSFGVHPAGTSCRTTTDPSSLTVHTSPPMSSSPVQGWKRTRCPTARNESWGPGWAGLLCPAGPSSALVGTAVGTSLPPGPSTIVRFSRDVAK